MRCALRQCKITELKCVGYNTVDSIIRDVQVHKIQPTQVDEGLCDEQWWDAERPLQVAVPPGFQMSLDVRSVMHEHCVRSISMKRGSTWGIAAFDLEKYSWTTRSGACSCDGGAVSLSGSRGLVTKVTFTTIFSPFFLTYQYPYQYFLCHHMT